MHLPIGIGIDSNVNRLGATVGFIATRDKNMVATTKQFETKQDLVFDHHSETKWIYCVWNYWKTKSYPFRHLRFRPDHAYKGWAFPCLLQRSVAQLLCLEHSLYWSIRGFNWMLLDDRWRIEVNYRRRHWSSPAWHRVWISRRTISAASCCMERACSADSPQWHT